jgi:hypothetical protein
LKSVASWQAATARLGMARAQRISLASYCRPSVGTRNSSNCSGLENASAISG